MDCDGTVTDSVTGQTQARDGRDGCYGFLENLDQVNDLKNNQTTLAQNEEFLENPSLPSHEQAETPSGSGCDGTSGHRSQTSQPITVVRARPCPRRAGLVPPVTDKESDARMSWSIPRKTDERETVGFERKASAQTTADKVKTHVLGRRNVRSFGLGVGDNQSYQLGNSLALDTIFPLVSARGRD